MSSATTLASRPELDADVAIVGCGPVGTLLAILLGQKGHRVVLLDKWPTPYQQPRAVTFDHEIARILAMLGIDSDNDPAIDYHDDLYFWKNAAGETLLEVDWKSIAASGWRTRYWFSQPELEGRLRSVAETVPAVTVRRGWEAVALEQDDRCAVLRGINRLDGGETVESIAARYVVGADGANSLVRSQLGLEFADHGYFFDWLILDMILNEDLDLGPSHWQLCDPARPTTIVPGGPGRRRWEFMALPGEDPTELASAASSWQLLESWGAHPGNAAIERATVYRFQARWATRWRNGRGLIAGDAAHLMPPFAGEGMCAGLRDAVAIAWRLDLVLAGLAEDGILDSYGTERLDHVQHYIDFSMRLGQIICITDPAEAAARDQRMIAELREGAVAPVDTELARLGAGLWHPDSPHGGELSVQGVVESGGSTGRFDDVVGRGWIVLSRHDKPADLVSAEQRDLWQRLAGRFVRVGDAGDGCDVVDRDGTYRRWFEDLGVEHAILRPDFYVAATAADASQLTERLDWLLERMHVRESVGAGR